MNPGAFRTVVLFVIAALVCGACGSGDDPTTPTAPVPVATAAPTEAATTEAPAPTEPADPFAIPPDPADIDEAYVERVLEELGKSIAGAARIVAREGRLTAGARELLASAHRGKSLQGIVEAFESAAAKRRTRRLFARDARPADIEVEELISATERCVFTRVLQDTSPLAGKAIDPFSGYYQLQVKRPDDDPDGRNATPWMITADGRPLPGDQEYADPCA